VGVALGGRGRLEDPKFEMLMTSHPQDKLCQSRIAEGIGIKWKKEFKMEDRRQKIIE
jgi:hypothetical protein